MDYSLAFKSFFGLKPDNIREMVILTNISPIYNALIDSAYYVGIRNKGFYEVTELCLSDGQYYHAIRITPGSSVIDVVRLLTLYIKKLYFVGLAGCLDSSHSTGDVCEPSEFVSQDSIFKCNEMAICQTSGLIQTNEFYIELQKRGVAYVDMESYDVYNICKNSHVPLKYIVQISDFPLEKPFYDVNPQPIKIKQIIKLLRDE